MAQLITRSTYKPRIVLSHSAGIITCNFDGTNYTVEVEAPITGWSNTPIKDL
jgi:hypothetical protein